MVTGDGLLYSDKLWKIFISKSGNEISDLTDVVYGIIIIIIIIVKKKCLWKNQLLNL